jgi:hypothetical protein
MAIIQNPLIGRARKSLGNTTFATWKGLNILKQKIFEPKKQTISDAVALNRAKMQLIGRTIGFISGFAKSIYPLGTTKTTAFAEIIKTFRMLIQGTLGALKFLVTDLVGTSFGSENTGGIFYTAGASAGSILKLTQDPITSNPLLLVADAKVTFFVINEDGTQCVYFDIGSSGSDTTVNLDCSEYFPVGTKVFAYSQGSLVVTPGSDLISKMAAQETPSFTTLIT